MRQCHARVDEQHPQHINHHDCGKGVRGDQARKNGWARPSLSVGLVDEGEMIGTLDAAFT
eukprot:255917-Prymnesium_polylepis.1